MSITANKRYGWLVGPYYTPGPFDSHQMVKIGRKEYGFNDGPSSGYTALVARYKCGHLEAQRRFKLDLVTRRLCAN